MLKKRIFHYKLSFGKTKMSVKIWFYKSPVLFNRCKYFRISRTVLIIARNLSGWVTREVIGNGLGAGRGGKKDTQKKPKKDKKHGHLQQMFIQVTTFQDESRERWLVMGWEQGGRGVQKRFLRANEGSRKRQHRLGAKMGKCKTWWKTPNQVALSFASKGVVIENEIGCKVNLIATKLVIVILTRV